MNVPTCIYCRGRDGPFKAAEHVVPESLGNHALVLPRGVVCDPCNNGVLATLDSRLVCFEPLHVLRSMRGVLSKKQRYKAFKAPELEVVRDRGGGVHVRANLRHADLGEHRSASFHATLTETMDHGLASTLARAVLKQMLGCMYADFGRKFVLESQFDPLRAVILGDEPYRGVVAFGRELNVAQYNQGVGGVTYQFVERFSEPPMWVQGRYLGFSVATIWGAREGRFDLGGVSADIAGNFNIIEVDPALGVR